MKKIWIVPPLAGMALSACVTINIYFPAAEAEKAADKIIGDIWQTETSVTAPKSSNPPPVTPEIKKEKAI
ncbi:hypothetical protein [Candidatus Nitrotoga sp. M5]|uniref:hypothetical protein n=1 Tax=Candidatus Nitrotoga sp. M5 TaxID=2890409 RepID=UPI001EF34DC3|nr:hypothetical protein [Candidatus Nitrotoga sp. M5]CAH1386450.1 conserved exported hypothetical protein [Candidatus Nitrotoga sp. M5]